MKLTKRKNDGRFVGTKTINGKKVYFYSSETTERKAQKDIENQLMHYESKKENKLYFNYIADEWWEEHTKHIAHNTEKYYHNSYILAKEHFGKDRITDITTRDIQRYIDDFADKGFSKKTVIARLSVLKLIFKYALIQEYIETDVSLYVKIPKNLPQAKRQALTPIEISRIISSKDLPFGLYAYFLLFTGTRKAEALALEWKDIDFKNKEVIISKSLEWLGNAPKVKAPKTEAGIRTISLPDTLLDELKKAYKRSNSQYVFADEKGEYMHHGKFEYSWNKYIQEANISVTPHQLRHTYATMLYEAGIDLKDAQSLMGHSDIKVTQNIYTHISEKQRKKTAIKLNDFMNTMVIAS